MALLSGGLTVLSTLAVNQHGRGEAEELSLQKQGPSRAGLRIRAAFQELVPKSRDTPIIYTGEFLIHPDY